MDVGKDNPLVLGGFHPQGQRHALAADKSVGTGKERGI